MNKIKWLMLALSIVLLTACGPDTPDNADPTPTLPGLPTTVPDDTPDPATATPDSYPMATETPAGYPAGEDTGDDDAYPAGVDTIWVIQPFGAQCGDPDDFLYNGDVDSAVADLEAQGIMVYRAGVVNLMVCEACDTCPTSEHFRVLIDSADFETVLDMGWLAEGEQ